MSGLWTPGGGEPREPEPAVAPAGDGPSAEEIAAVRELHAQLRAAPVVDVIVNHAIGIWQLALVHLGVATPPDEDGRQPEPDLAAAGLAIDALSALVDGLTERLGEAEDMLREALTEAQRVYVAVADAISN